MVKVLLYVHKNHKFIRDGSPGPPPQLSHSSWDMHKQTNKQNNYPPPKKKTTKKQQQQELKKKERKNEGGKKHKK